MTATFIETHVGHEDDRSFWLTDAQRSLIGKMTLTGASHSKILQACKAHKHLQMEILNKQHIGNISRTNKYAPIKGSVHVEHTKGETHSVTIMRDQYLVDNTYKVAYKNHCADPKCRGVYCIDCKCCLFKFACDCDTPQNQYCSHKHAVALFEARHEICNKNSTAPTYDCESELSQVLLKLIETYSVHGKPEIVVTNDNGELKLKTNVPVPRTECASTSVTDMDNCEDMNRNSNALFDSIASNCLEGDIADSPLNVCSYLERAFVSEIKNVDVECIETNDTITGQLRNTFNKIMMGFDRLQEEQQNRLGTKFLQLLLEINSNMTTVLQRQN